MSIFIGLPVSALLGLLAYLAVSNSIQSSGLTLGRTYFTKRALSGSAALLSIALSGLASLRVELKPEETYSLIIDSLTTLPFPLLLGIAGALIIVVGSYYWSYIEQFMPSISNEKTSRAPESTPPTLTEVGSGLYALAAEPPSEKSMESMRPSEALATNFDQNEFDLSFDAAYSASQEFLAQATTNNNPIQQIMVDNPWNEADLSKTEELLALEEALQEKSQQLSLVETEHLNLFGRVQELEEQTIKAKNLLLQAKSEIRKNMEARSKALHSAHKAMLFSRRSMAARTRAEDEIKQIRSQLDVQLTENAKLQAALSEHKRRPVAKSDVEERIARKKRSATEDLLTNKLIKKVAKRRMPLRVSTEDPFSTGDRDSIPTLVTTALD